MIEVSCRLTQNTFFHAFRLLDLRVYECPQLMLKFLDIDLLLYFKKIDFDLILFAVSILITICTESFEQIAADCSELTLIIDYSEHIGVGANHVEISCESFGQLAVLKAHERVLIMAAHEKIVAAVLVVVVDDTPVTLIVYPVLRLTYIRSPSDKVLVARVLDEVFDVEGATKELGEPSQIDI